MKTLAAAFISALLISAIAGVILVNFAWEFYSSQPPVGIRIGSGGNVEGTDRIRCNGSVYALTGNTYNTIVVLREKMS